MEIHRVVHDFQELSYADLEAPVENKTESPSVPLIAIALSFGVLLGYLALRR